MTIRADGPKVVDWVRFVFFTEAGEFTQMVNMNHTIAQLARYDGSSCRSECRT